MVRRLAGVLTAVALLIACGDEPAPAARSLPDGLRTDASLLRLPRNGGSAVLLHPEKLTPLGWKISGDVPPIVRAIAADLEDRTVYAVGKRGELIGIDLLSRRVRVDLAAARQLTGTDDGSVLALDSTRRPLRFSNRALTAFHATVETGPVTLLRGPSTQIVAVSTRENVAQVLGEGGELRRFTVPAGEASTTWFGDLMAVTTDSGVVLIDPSGKYALFPQKGAIKFLHIRGNPIVSVFSPSAHRLYVARKRGDLVMLDRYTGDNLKTLTLPGPAHALRVDRSGRWLLAKGASGDSVYVVDLARWDVAATIITRWAEDLPIVTDGKTLVAREKNDVVAFDLTATTLAEGARVKGGAGDVYLALAWTPKGGADETKEVAVRPADDTARTTAKADLSDSTKRANGLTGFFLQVSSSQNQEWAKNLAQQLHEDGFPARVIDPRSPEEGFRVVIGPYATHEEADAAGKRLGRTYFIIPPGTIPG